MSKKNNLKKPIYSFKCKKLEHRVKISIRNSDRYSWKLRANGILMQMTENILIYFIVILIIIKIIDPTITIALFKFVKAIGGKITKQYSNTNFVMLLGQQAVGKTTLLSLMYKEISRNSGFQMFAACDDTGIALDEAYQKLRLIIDQPNFTQPTRLLAGTAGIVTYDFNIDNSRFTICDTAGGLIMKKGGGKDFEDFITALSKASVIINVIDGAAMMEGSEFLSDRVNSPNRIRDLLIQYKGNRSCLILFVITKCEAWMKGDNDIEQMRKSFEDRHKAVLNWVNQNKNCVGILIPVKTLGCVEFSYKVGKGDSETLVFHKKTNLKFSQEYVDKPLMYAVRYCMNQTLLPIEKHFICYGNRSIFQQ